MQLPSFQLPPRWTPGAFFPPRKETARSVLEGLRRNVRAAGSLMEWGAGAYLTGLRGMAAEARKGRFPRVCMVLAAVFLLFGTPTGRAVADVDGDDTAGTHEYQTKAEFLFSFAKFIDWPPHKFTQPDSPLVIGIVGTDPFGGLLEEAVQDKRINDHTVTIRHVEAMEELRKCHIIFVSRSEASRLGPILSEVRGDNVLTVGESDKFISRGGMINFVMIGNTVRFEINDKEARHAGLKISSKLSSLAVPTSR